MKVISATSRELTRHEVPTAPGPAPFESLGQDLYFEILSRCRPADAARFAAASRECRSAASDPRLPEAWGPRLEKPLWAAGLSVPPSLPHYPAQAEQLRAEHAAALSSFRMSKFQHQIMVDASLQMCGAPNCLDAVWNTWSSMEPHASMMTRCSAAAEAMGLQSLPQEPYVATAQAIARSSRIPTLHKDSAVARIGPTLDGGFGLTEEATRDLERSLGEVSLSS